MFAFFPTKRALAATALVAGLACGDASPADAMMLFGFDTLGNSSARAATNYSPRPFDGGGNVQSYFANVHAANYSPRRTVIAGVCASACTMKLGIRNACVEPDATLLFHQASFNGFRSELGTRVMLYAYPLAVRHWVLRTGALSSSALTELSGREAIGLGVRAC